MEIGIAEFKSKALAILDRVHREGLPVTVTKRGKPLVKVIPITEKEERRSLKGTLLHQDENIFSTDEIWDADL